MLTLYLLVSKALLERANSLKLRGVCKTLTKWVLSAPERFTFAKTLWEETLLQRNRWLRLGCLNMYALLVFSMLINLHHKLVDSTKKKNNLRNNENREEILKGGI